MREVTPHAGARGPSVRLVLDCGPSLSLLNQNALYFADQVLIPVACDYLSLVGVKQILETLPLPARLDQARIDRAKRYAFHFFFRRMIPASADRVAAIVAVSGATARAVEEALEPEAPVLVIAHGVDHQRFRPATPGDPADLAVLDPLGVRPPYIAFVGTIEPRKDLGTLIGNEQPLGPESLGESGRAYLASNLLDELSAVGYGTLTIEAVAARAVTRFQFSPTARTGARAAPNVPKEKVPSKAMRSL